MTQDCSQVVEQVYLNVNVFLRTMVSIVTTLVFMFAITTPLTLVAFVSVPAVVIISMKYGRIMKDLSTRTQKALADANAVADEGLANMPTVRSFAAEKLESGRFFVAMEGFRKLMNRRAAFYLVYLSSAMMLPQAVTALVLFYGGKLAMSGQMHAGSLLSFVFYLQTLNSNFSTLGDFYSNMVQAVGAAVRVFELCERKPRSPDMDGCWDEAQERAWKGAGALQLRDLHFSYPARPDVKILSGLSLDVAASTVVALVGPSGNGKSTVISLLKRLYHVEEGSITLDGIPIWNFSHEQFHRVVSIVGQEPVLFARTIRENIVLGLENPEKIGGEDLPATGGISLSFREIEDLATKANAHDFISKMPKGYATEVGERGVQLSGGQKQRIAIARSLARRPKVLLLDEATSALDAESELQVQRAIDSMIAEGSMTVIIIAHRLSTVKNSDKICVIKGGQVVEEGKHDELLSAGGAYFQLVACQLSGSGTSPPAAPEGC
ncbi:ABCB9, partial [Symbiodinium sp. KB8]